MMNIVDNNRSFFEWFLSIGKWVGRNGTIEWPARSPTLSLWIFFMRIPKGQGLSKIVLKN